MEFAVPSALVALAVLLFIWRSRAARRKHAAEPLETEGHERILVVLDIEAGPGSSSVRRFVQEAADRVFAEAGHVREIEVRGRDGVVLGVVHRGGAPVRPEESPARIAGRSSRARSPSVRTEDVAPPVTPRFEPRDRPPPERRLTDVFDLPEPVRALLKDPADPVDLVRCILEAAGLPATVSGDEIRSGDHVVIVLARGAGRTTQHDALNHAFMRFRESGAPRGLVLAMDYLDALEVRRREILAPELRHGGHDAIQRMADAVEVGADPLAFAMGASIVSVLAERSEPERDTRRAG